MKKKESLKSEAKAKTSKKSSPGKKDFLVVGIGASAGGVKAIQEFFATMPPESGMAFVVILHLSPEHESNLKEIIQIQTPMPVTLVTETHKVEPNRVYVIPPNRQLEMVDGTVRSTALKGDRGVRVAIDVFFRTLADEYRDNAVCVVLSGTGTDGTVGVKAIKEANGFAVVQQPEDAEHEGMPRSAIATGIVDWVLPVGKMAERLIQFRDSSERLHLTTDNGDSDDAEKVAAEIQADESLREILTVLRVRTGHDFSNYKTPTLIRRIARHLQIHDLEDIPSYLEYLRKKPEDIHSLVKNLLINVTNFFRDKEAWTALEREVIPNLFVDKGANDAVRVWSVGGASGEEAYSLAIILMEYAERLPDAPKIQVFATDVDEDAIAEAREHRYPQSIEADVSPERLKRFFVKEGKYYRVKKELRETVLFAPHNVLRDPPFSRLDLITCRNLLIYLNRETQERVMEIFHFALSSTGCLFLGSSETAEAVPALFAPLDKKQRIYTRRTVALSQQAPPQMPVTGRWEVKIPENKRKAHERASAVGEVHYKLLEEIAPPSILVNQDFDIQFMSNSAGRYLRLRGGAPFSNILKLVSPDLLADLRAALFTVQREKKTSQFENINAVIDGEQTVINLIVRPVEVEHESSDFLLVIFDENKNIILPKVGEEKNINRPAVRDEAMEAVIDELARTKDNLRLTIEQHEVSVEELKASNEELQAINEELRSTTEELETSKEELQSVNEELTTVNHELKEKMDETTRMNSDLQNLMASTDIATIFLDRSFRIKRFTTPVEHLFNITVLDIGRPLEHFTHRLDYPDLQRDAAEVLRKLMPFEREIRDNENNVYLTRFAPYRTVDDRIEGVVLNFIDITERKRAEDALRESEAKLAVELADTQQLQRISSALIVEDDIDAFYEQILEAARSVMRSDSASIQMLVPERGELLLLAHKGFAPESAEHWKWVRMSETTSCGLAMSQDERIVVADAELWDLFAGTEDLAHYRHSGIRAMQSTRLVSRNGRLVGMISTHWREPHEPSERELRLFDVLARQVADLIERRTAEEALRASEERLQRTIEIETVSVIFFNEKGEFTDCSEAFSRMSGFTREEISSGDLSWKDLTPPEWMERSEQAIRELEETGRITPYEKEYFRKDGSRFWALFAGAKVSERETVEYVIDVSVRKQAEERLRKSEQHLNLILESAKDYAIITFDLEGRITRWNKGAEMIFGWSEREAVGETTHLIFTPEDVAALAPEKEMMRALKTGSAEDERWHVRKDGTRFFASGVMQVLGDGETEGFVKIARDQTERLKAEVALREKEMLARLVSTQEDERRRIAREIHDHLGQQLTVLRLKLDQVKKQCQNEEICDDIEELQQITEKLDRDTDFLAWELRPASLDDLGLRLTLANFVKEWSKYSGIKAEFHSSGLTHLHLNLETETNLYRIAQEALNNVYKHAKAKNVSVLLEKRGDTVSLIVEDDGVGFNPSDKKNRTKGIGLVGMIERAKLCGGELEIESAKGKGATVFVRLPPKKA